MNNHSPATTQEDRDWSADMNHIGGDWERPCQSCGLPFRGFRRRQMCRACRRLKIYFPSVFKKEEVSK